MIENSIKSVFITESIQKAQHLSNSTRKRNNGKRKRKMTDESLRTLPGAGERRHAEGRRSSAARCDVSSTRTDGPRSSGQQRRSRPGPRTRLCSGGGHLPPPQGQCEVASWAQPGWGRPGSAEGQQGSRPGAQKHGCSSCAPSGVCRRAGRPADWRWASSADPPWSGGAWGCRSLCDQSPLGSHNSSLQTTGPQPGGTRVQGQLHPHTCFHTGPSP